MGDQPQTAHVLILGQTLSGKTTLAKQLTHFYRGKNVKVILLDPMNDPGYHADFRTRDPNEFLRVLWDSEGCAGFIDESGKFAGRYDDAMIETATESRHFGHRCHYISQRGAQLSVTLRQQCTQMFLFSTSQSDCKIHSNEWNEPEFLTGHQLPQFHYLYKQRFQPVQRLKLEK